MPLQVYHLSSSEKGLSSVTTLIVGSKSAVIIDPPFLKPDAEAVVTWIKKTTSNPVDAVFVTHHHPDHYFSAAPVLDAFPTAKFYAAPYVLAGINREYDEKIKFWPTVFGAENLPSHIPKPEPYPYSFFLLPGDMTSPVMLLGPVQGDTVDHTLFWLPVEKVVVVGDAMYARTTHMWCEEIETPQVLEAWKNVLDLIEALKPVKIITGHLEAGNDLDTAADLAYNRKYLQLFSEKITYAKTKLKPDQIYDTFRKEFPVPDKNLDFLLKRTAEQFGEGGQVWEENRHHNIGARTAKDLMGYNIGFESEKAKA